MRGLLVEKYGKEFALAAIDNTDSKVAPRVLKKLRVEPPESVLVTLYLKEIARTYNITYHTGNTPPESEKGDNDDDDENPSGGIKEPVAVTQEQEELAKATPPRAVRPAINVAPQSPTSENVHPVIKMPDPPKYGVQKAVAVKKTPALPPPPQLDDNDLARRFAALKR